MSIPNTSNLVGRRVRSVADPQLEGTITGIAQERRNGETRVTAISVLRDGHKRTERYAPGQWDLVA